MGNNTKPQFWPIRTHADVSVLEIISEMHSVVWGQFSLLDDGTSRQSQKKKNFCCFFVNVVSVLGLSEPVSCVKVSVLLYNLHLVSARDSLTGKCVASGMT